MKSKSYMFTAFSYPVMVGFVIYQLASAVDFSRNGLLTISEKVVTVSGLMIAL
ncbi:hypothetical protein [Paenibacillus agilis]|uniref:hypothetical protein n=1 Tax=Paenibacillus agilis TaxID=3020863 RepID=UPI001649D104|nr:hypothetical protein [Paenibacillus agilis]